MKVSSFAVNMASSASMTKSHSVSEKTTFKVQPFALQLQGAVTAGPQSNGGNGAAVLALSPAAQARASNGAGTNVSGTGNSGGAFEMSSKDNLKLQLIEQLMRSLTGKKIDMNKLDKRGTGGQTQQVPAVPDYKPLFQLQAISLMQREFTMERTETYHESQSMSFKASGVVNTADGRQINFDLNVLANYEFSSSSTVISEGRLVDPLVINFDGTLPEFTKDRYEFDITIDGDPEKIFMPTKGSGFLALDKNDNGKIDDGSELFGAATGDGFGELAAYDTDGNGWIDEGDAVFEMLKIMFADRETGEFILMSLKEADVGAIYLGSSAAGNFEIKAGGNETVGVVRKNGIFLSESGNVGSVHHIDLTY